MRITVYRFTGKQGFFHVPERWCEECDLLVAAARRVAAEEAPGTEVVVKPWWVHLPIALFRYGIWHPPGLVVEGRRVLQGAVPTDDQLRGWLREGKARAAARGSAQAPGSG